MKIKLARNGPYLVEGDFTLVDENGQEMELKKKALCRCGGSVTKPFCDGTHSRIGFQGASAAVKESDAK